MSNEDHLNKIKAMANGQVDPLTPEESAADQLLAAIEGGYETFETADEDLLGVAIDRHGMKAVNEAIDRGAELRRKLDPVPIADDPKLADRESQSDASQGKLLGGAHWFQRAPVRIGVVAAAALAVVFLMRDRSGTEQPEESAWELAWNSYEPGNPTGRAIPLPETVVPDGEPGWEQTLRGGSDPATQQLIEHVVVLELERTFGCATLLDSDGWILTASDLIEDEVQSAARRGETASVAVRGLRLDSEDSSTVVPDEALRTAAVMLHFPSSGMSLLKLQDLEGLPDSTLDIADETPAPGVKALVAAVSAASGLRIGEEAIGSNRNPVSFELPGRSPVASTLGAPVFEGEEPYRLLGVLLGQGSGKRTQVSSPAATLDLLTRRPASPVPYPVNPMVATSGSTRWIEDLPSPEPSGDHATLVRTVSPNDETTLALFLSSVPRAPEAETAAGLPGSAEPDGFQFDVFLAKWHDGSVAIGRTNEGSQVDRIALRRPKADSGLILWEMNSAGEWTVSREGGTTLGTAARISADELRRLEAALKD